MPIHTRQNANKTLLQLTKERDKLAKDVMAERRKSEGAAGGTGGGGSGGDAGGVSVAEVETLKAALDGLTRERDSYKQALRTVESGGKKDAQELIQSLIEVGSTDYSY